MASLQSLTKAQLIERCGQLDAQLIAKGREIEQLRNRVAQQPIGHGLGGSIDEHRAYHRYVAQCKAQQREQGKRVLTYKTFAQWRDAR